jgi:hypothetical protein
MFKKRFGLRFISAGKFVPGPPQLLRQAAESFGFLPGHEFDPANSKTFVLGHVPRNTRILPSHCSHVLCQGTTLVGPYGLQSMRALAPQVRFSTDLRLGGIPRDQQPKLQRTLPSGYS